uniref:Uncharacterized protein n=1 Tax=Magnetospirillum gryphiswaldense TaxID=55518 RepID=A4TZ70_9PROT|nr:hypothetical protein MGR_2304 [Magnetospirillum gryphiswaldense MSR-1]
MIRIGHWCRSLCFNELSSWLGSSPSLRGGKDAPDAKFLQRHIESKCNRTPLISAATPQYVVLTQEFITGMRK